MSFMNFFNTFVAGFTCFVALDVHATHPTLSAINAALALMNTILAIKGEP